MKPRQSQIIFRPSHRVSMIKDRVLLKEIEKIIKNSEGSYDIYQLFTNSTRIISLTVPPTLMKVPKFEPTYLKTSSGRVIFSRTNAITDFFKENQNAEGSPQFIHFSDAGLKVFFTAKAALSAWGSCGFEKQMLQKYIIPLNRQPVKLRVFWTVSEGAKYYLIKSAFPYPKNRTMKNINSSDCLPSKFKHNLSDYPFAGQLLKSSFNFFMPEQSQIKSACRSVKKNNKVSLQKETYIAKASKDVITPVAEEGISQHVKFMMEALVNCMNNSIGKHDKKVVTELLVDFAVGETENWFVLKCKAHRCDYLTSKVIEVPNSGYKRSILNINFARGFFESIIERQKKEKANENLSLSGFTQRLKNIDRINSNIKLKRNILVSMQKTEAEELQNYLTNLPITEPFKTSRILSRNSHKVSSSSDSARLLHRKFNSLPDS